jgi:hypothetical protein
MLDVIEKDILVYFTKSVFIQMLQSSTLNISTHSDIIGIYVDNDELFKKEGCYTLKGTATATKRIKNDDHKLKIEFSSKLGGPVGPNTRTFVNEIILFTNKKAPLNGVKKWKDIELNVRSSIAIDILVCAISLVTKLHSMLWHYYFTRD